MDEAGNVRELDELHGVAPEEALDDNDGTKRVVNITSLPANKRHLLRHHVSLGGGGSDGHR